MKIKVFNQGFNLFKMDCTVITCSQTIKNMYGVDFRYPFLDTVVKYFIKIKLLFQGGANFENLYDGYCNEINTRLDLEMIVKKALISSAGFEQGTEIGYSRGLRLKNGNSEYLKAIEKGYITKEDINKIAKQGGGFLHNNCRTINTLHEVATGQEIVLDLEVLRYGVQQGVFGNTARTFIPNNNYTNDVCELLQRWRDDKYYDPIKNGKTSSYYKEVMNKSANILLKYEIKK